MDDTTKKIHIEFIASRGIGDFLRLKRVSLVVTTYQAGNVYLIGAAEGDSLRVKPMVLERPMGISVQGESLYIGSLYQVHRLNNVLPPGVVHEGSDRLYAPVVHETCGA